jgi:dTDP-4-dehydrorhamnose 3,5-epimerase
VKITPLALDGVRLVEIEPIRDERGFFARAWCRDEFAQAGIDFDVAQASVSFNALAGTVRGLHFAWPPAREAKLVRCTRGRVHDVLVDLRPHSPQFLQHLSVVLDAGQHNALHVPPGVAHGFQSLVDDTEVLYLMSEAYRPELASGARFDDPRFGVAWPLDVTCISAADRQRAAFDEAAHVGLFGAHARADRHVA